MHLLHRMLLMDKTAKGWRYPWKERVCQLGDMVGTVALQSSFYSSRKNDRQRWDSSLWNPEIFYGKQRLDLGCHAWVLFDFDSKILLSSKRIPGSNNQMFFKNWRGWKQEGVLAFVTFVPLRVFDRYILGELSVGGSNPIKDAYYQQHLPSSDILVTTPRRRALG